MPRGDTQAQNHPHPGSSIKVEPIRDLQAIKKIKDCLRQRSLRDFCLFTVGINTAYRGSDLLSLTVGQVAHLHPGDILEIKERKTRKYRAVTLNNTAFNAIQDWLARHPAAGIPDAALFYSLCSRKGLGISALNRLVKKWCAGAGLKGNFGSHTLRKTWGYHQRMKNSTPVPLLMVAFGHSTQAQTLEYLGIQDEEVSDLYTSMEL